MYTDIEAKPFSSELINSLSERQVNEHLKLYKGYVAKVNEISKSTKDCEAFTGSNPTYSCMRSVKLGESFALNGVKLHELYFENISGSSSKCSADSEFSKLIKEQYSDCECFKSYLKQAALSVRGWAVVAIDSVTKRLRVIGLDAHDVGSVWCAFPLLVIDVYEHAYFIDYGTDRGKYLDDLLENINWAIVEARLEKFSKLKEFM